MERKRRSGWFWTVGGQGCVAKAAVECRPRRHGCNERERERQRQRHRQTYRKTEREASKSRETEKQTYR